MVSYFCGMRRNKRKKVFENLEVTDAGSKGKAIAHAPDGRVVFIDNAVPGDVATVETYQKRKAFYKAKATDFERLSEKRTQPVCQHFGVCGGCKWQNMSYEHQLFYKQKEVENNLRRIGKIDFPTSPESGMEPILGNKKHYFYRNKMEFSFSNNRWLTSEEINSREEFEKNALGFHIPGMWDKILDIEKCWLQEDPSNAIRNSVKNFAIENGLTFFDPRKQEGLLRTLMIRISSTGEVMVLVQFFEEDKDRREKLLNFIRVSFPEITSLLYVINSKKNDTIYDQEVFCFSGREYIFEEMEGLKFKINPKSFYQTNSEQAYELYKITRDFAAIKGDELVYDLYTGTGTIAQFVSKNQPNGQAGAKKVIGIESVPEAIEDAKANAELNGIFNTEFYVGDMRSILNDDFVATHGKPKIIITDPPRDGMHQDVVNQILRILPDRIVYVSCNSATQARDLALMTEKYRVTRIRPVDMFPQTHHVENVVCLEKR